MAPLRSGLAFGMSLPSSWAAVGTVILLEGLFLHWFQPASGMAIAAGGLGVMLLALWAGMVARSDAAARHWYQETRHRHQARQAQIDQLKHDLHRLGSDRGAWQLDAFQRKLSTLTDVLKQRLDAGELTYGRYIAVAEQVYLSALDNLHDVAVSLKSVSTIDRDELDGRLSALHSEAAGANASAKEIATLERRRSLLDRQLDKVNDLLVQNETALTAMDHATAALADARMDKGSAPMDLDRALKELDQLAGRAAKYAALGHS